MRHLLPCPPCGRQGRPGQGFLAGSNTSEPRGSAPRERDHRGGDHPVPSRTRQLSPPSPRVLQRKAAGGQGVALAEGAFLCLRGSAREEMCGGAPHAPGEARRGIAPCGPLLRHEPGPRRVLRLCGVKRRASPKGPRRIAWEAVEGPLRSRARSTADGRVSCPCRPATGGSLFRALPAFWGGLGVAGGVASSAGVLSRRGVPCWAGSARSMRRRFCVGPLAGFFCVNGGLAI